MAKETILVTGANGIVGCELVRALLKAPDAPALRLLVRGSPAEVDAKRRWLSDWVGAPLDADGGVRLLAGDVSAPSLGLSPEVYGALRREVTGVLHAAAATAFHQSASQGQKGNVVGTGNVLDFARDCARLDRFGLISTIYVAGARTGDVAEADLDLEATFLNEYERSKAQAEGLSRRAEGLPVATYRFGVVVGRLTDGRIARLSGVYPIWRMFYQGLLAMIPGDPAQAVDLIPSDYAAEATAHLFRRAFEPGATYHVCAGAARSYTLGELLPAVGECIARVDEAWPKLGYPLPEAVSPRTFEEFADTVELIAHPGLRGVVRQMRLFTRQLEYPKRFSTDRFERGLEGSGLALAHAREWLPKLVAQGVASGWREPGWGAAYV